MTIRFMEGDCRRTEHEARVGHIVVHDYHAYHSDDCATRPIAL
jgi:hypothetical protein